MDNNQIKFKYVFEDDYEPEYINGAFGGVNPNGELIVNFFMERVSMPTEEVFSLAENGTLEREVGYSKESVPKIRRRVKTGVIMSKETAIGIYEWLGEQLKDMGEGELDE